MSNFKFKCPICNKEADTSTASIEKVITNSKHIGTKVRGRTVTQTYRETYYNVRFCSKCYKRKEKYNSILIVFVFLIIPILYSIYYFSGSSHNGVWNFIVLLFMLYFALLFVYGIINKIVEALFFDVDIEKAIKDNAIEDRFYGF